MPRSKMGCISLIITALCIFTFHSASADTTLQTYIVHVSLPGAGLVSGQLPSEDLGPWYNSFLPGPSRVVHTYRNVITGFAAQLSAEEVKVMETKDGFLHARPQRKYDLHTTHSPNFLGLHQNVGAWPGANYGEGVIIGVIDSGITPAHPSFSDEGMPPPPAKWKGKCELNGTVLCNNKLIGARNLASQLPGPPIDDFGHGTHTASTAGGNFVPNANVFGQANGTASGIAPRAHLAIYKVGSLSSLLESDILAGMDAAIEDGVDVLTISIGGPSVPFYEDSIALGAFSAIEKGIFVSCSAANGGPDNSSLANEAPWILTVGASTTDRKIKATAVLGNQETYDGESLYQPEVSPELLPLVYAGNGSDENAAWCGPGSLENLDVKGKVVLCEGGGFLGPISKGQTVKEAGGAAMILMNDESSGYFTLPEAHVLPATQVSYSDGLKIKSYINSTSTPTAAISFGGTVIGDKNAPVVALFSSRGPSLASPGILKPDIIGPGVSILAAWPVSVDNYTDETATFNMISGTSMSCPHLGGVAALIKSAHPSWSPAMIKSAIMTSATQINLNNKPILDQQYLPADVFAIGAGHVNPSMALDPGLVYDLTTSDYIAYLCFLYTEQQVEIIVGQKINCNGSEYTGVPEAQLNYPSFSVILGYTGFIYSRTVTNVGEANSTYYARIESVPGVNVTVVPTVLSFSSVNQQLTYKVSFSRQEFSTNGSYVQGSVSWISSKHVVRIPVSVKLVL